MRIYLKNNSANFHPNPIWNDGALGFYEERRFSNEKNKKKNNNNKTSSDRPMGSVPNPDPMVKQTKGKQQRCIHSLNAMH